MRSVGLYIRNLRLNMLSRAAIVLAASGLTSCDNKELCLDHWDHALRYSVDYRVDWSREWQYPLDDSTDWMTRWGALGLEIDYDDLRPTKPTGVRVLVYTDGHNSEQSNISADGGIVNMTPGEHQILFYNNNTEYIVFNDLNSSVQASATTRSRSRTTYLGNSTLEKTDDENTVNPPDFLFGHYIGSYTVAKAQVPPVVSVTMKPLVYRYLVRYHIDKGLENVALGRGALAGMAASVYLTDGHTGSNEATVLYDCEVKSGWIEAVVNTFGVPNYPNPDYSRAPPGTYGLNLEVRLTKGRMLNYDFDITDQIVRQPRGGVIEVGGIIIPDEFNQMDSGSFDVGIDGWGEYEDVIIDFGSNTIK